MGPTDRRCTVHRPPHWRRRGLLPSTSRLPLPLFQRHRSWNSVSTPSPTSAPSRGPGPIGPHQRLRNLHRGDRAGRPGRARRVRPRRASPARLCGLGAGGGAGRGRRAHQAHPADQRRHRAVLGRSGARLPAVRHARSAVGRPRRDHGRARLVHRILPAVRLRPRRLRRAVRRKARSAAGAARQRARHLVGQACARRSTTAASIRARCRTGCRSGSPSAARRNRWCAPARSACRWRSPSSAASRRASRRCSTSIARPRGGPATTRETLRHQPQRARLHRRDHRAGGRRFLRAAGRGDEPHRPRARLGSDQPRAFRPVARAAAARCSSAIPRRWPKRSSPSTRSSATTASCCRWRSAPMPHDKIMKAIELYGTKVAPIVRKAVAARKAALPAA